LRGQHFKPLAIGNGGLQAWGRLGGHAPTHIATILPDLMLEVRTDLAGLPVGRTGPVFRLEAPLLHALERNHLVDKVSSLGQKISIQSPTMSIC
jgi:hypothetical protein